MHQVILGNCEALFGIAKAVGCLSSGRSPMDAVEAGIRAVESHVDATTVGLGGAPNILGQVECDAAIMCGLTRRSGAVAALQDISHAISVARKVMELTPHVFLAGDGAKRFAAEIGEPSSSLLTERSRQDYIRWLENSVPKEAIPALSEVALAPLVQRPSEQNPVFGTACMIVLDRDGLMAGGVSTSGWPYKYPGRVGDSPVIGAGLYVDARFGAAACTHTGELTIRAATARMVVALLGSGACLQDACVDALNDIKLLWEDVNLPVVVHAMSKDGEIAVMGVGNIAPDTRYVFWDSITREVHSQAVSIVP